MKKVFTILLLLGVMLAVAGCTDSESSQNESKFVVAVPQDPDFLDPHKAAASGTEEMMFNVFEGLLKANHEGKMVPAVASSYDVNGLEYTFKLRKDIKFHNGNNVTIEDVEYSYKRLRGDFSEKPLSSGFEGVEITVIDSETIKFVLPEINASFLGYLTEAVIPASLTDEDHNKNPVGTGPYSFVEYVPSQKVVITRFDEYWQKDVASIKDVEFRIFADNQTALMSLQSGAIDLYPRINAESIDSIPEDCTYIEGPQNMIQIMAMNNKVEPFNSIKVRQAINYAVDVDAIITAVANGRGLKLGSNMSPAMKVYYQEGLEDTYNLNLEKARQLLKEAGYEEGFTTSITVPSVYQFHVDTAQVIASQLAEVGITAEIKKIDWNAWLQEVYTNRNYEMTVIALTGKLDPHAVLNRYSSDYGRNFFNYANDQYDELMKQAVITTDQEQRELIYKEAQQILADEVPCVYIMDPNLIVAMKKNVKGYQLYPIYIQDIAVLTLTAE